MQSPHRPPARVVVVSGSVGAGHDGVANELARRLRERGDDVFVVDQLVGFAAWARFLLGAGYLLLLRTAPVLYDATCWVVERSRLVQRIADTVCRTSERWLLEVARECDLIVATYPPACRALGHLRATGRLEVPVIGYLTDPGPNFLWVHPGLDRHFTAGEHTAAEVIERYGVDAEAVGPLVAPRFREMSHPSARASARRHVRGELGLAADDVVALLLLGSLGIGGVKRAAQALAAAGIRPIVLCARNERLRRRLNQLPGVLALGWRDDMATLIAASDVVVNNAGGLSLTESFVVGVPAVTYTAVAGHGKANARSLQRGGLAPWASSLEELVAQVTALAAIGRVPWPEHSETAVERLSDLLSTATANAPRKYTQERP